VHGGSAKGGPLGQAQYRCCKACDFDLCGACMGLGQDAPKPFAVGDVVEILAMPVMEAEFLARDHGEWSGDSMAKLLGTVGAVTDISDDGLGSLRVRGKLWNPAAVAHAAPDAAQAWSVVAASGGGAAVDEPVVFGGLEEGDVVMVRNVAPNEAQRIVGNIGFRDEMAAHLGTRGTVTSLVVDGNLESVECQGFRWSPDMLTKLGGPDSAHRRLTVGEEVVLCAEGAQRFPETVGNGSLRPGQVGRVIVDDGSAQPFKVQAGSSSSWFNEPCIERAPPLSQRSPMPPRLTVGDDVVAGRGTFKGNFGKVIADDRSALPFRVEFRDGDLCLYQWLSERALTRVWGVGSAVRVRSVTVNFAALIMQAPLAPAAVTLLGKKGTVEALTAEGRLVVGGVAWEPEMLEPVGGWPAESQSAGTGRPRAATSAAVQEMVEAFKEFDTGGTGAISVDVLRQILGSMGDTPMPATEVENIIRTAEVDGAGNIRYKSLVKTMLGEEDSGGDGNGKQEMVEELVMATFPGGWTKKDLRLLRLADKGTSVRVTSAGGPWPALGVKEGDTLVAVNNEDCRGRPFSEVFPVLVMASRLSAPCSLTVARGADESTSEEELVFDVLRSGLSMLSVLAKHCPQHVLSYIKSDEFTLTCRENFAALDTDGSGSLSADELLPVISSLATSTGTNLTSLEHSRKFLRIFDTDNDGTLDLGEYLDFVAFSLVLGACNDAGVDVDKVIDDGQFKLMLARKEIDNRIECIKVTFRVQAAELEAKASPSAKAAMRVTAKERFAELDTDGSGKLDAEEVRTVVIILLEAEAAAVTEDHARGLMDFFDEDGDGQLNYKEFERLIMVILLIAENKPA